MIKESFGDKFIKEFILIIHFYRIFTSMEDIAKDYLTWDPNPDTKAQIEQLLKNNETSKLQSLLGSRLQFGTAGLRGPMGPGYNSMNELVVLQTSQGLARYLEEVVPSCKSMVCYPLESK